ncbi:MAG TPA: nitroreductase/quinone reductase family protein [Acidimicrobiales bacterium]|nr:nitroreductase/quinone reductase family protein [Acidimicrobiales bacterium]
MNTSTTGRTTDLTLDGGPARRPTASAPTGPLGPVARFWRNRTFARTRHRLLRMRRTSSAVTRLHGRLIRLSGGRVQRSLLFTGGMPVLVLTTTGRRSGRSRSVPVGFLRHGRGFAVLASNAGSDRPPAWWLNLQADPAATVLADRRRTAVLARQTTESEDRELWSTFARLNPGFDEYRRLTTRRIPVVVLEPTS